MSVCMPMSVHTNGRGWIDGEWDEKSMFNNTLPLYDWRRKNAALFQT